MPITRTLLLARQEGIGAGRERVCWTGQLLPVARWACSGVSVSGTGSGTTYGVSNVQCNFVWASHGRHKHSWAGRCKIGDSERQRTNTKSTFATVDEPVRYTLSHIHRAAFSGSFLSGTVPAAEFLQQSALIMANTQSQASCMFVSHLRDSHMHGLLQSTSCKHALREYFAHHYPYLPWHGSAQSTEISTLRRSRALEKRPSAFAWPRRQGLLAAVQKGRAVGRRKGLDLDRPPPSTENPPIVKLTQPTGKHKPLGEKTSCLMGVGRAGCYPVPASARRVFPVRVASTDHTRVFCSRRRSPCSCLGKGRPGQETDDPRYLGQPQAFVRSSRPAAV